MQLYFGLLIFVGYMVVDTQEIIEKAHLGDLDYVKHALTLFTDFVAVFVRILIIMVRVYILYYISFVESEYDDILCNEMFVYVMQLKNSAEKEERKKRRRD